MGFITKNILTGLFTILPIALTFYLLYWLVVSMESLLGYQLTQWLPEGIYKPGVGVAAGLILCFIVGMLMHTYVVQQIFERGEKLFYRIPLVKMIYPAIRDFLDYLSPMKKKEYQQVVAVTFGDTGIQAIGLVTQTDMSKMPDGLNGEDCVLVYLPMSYMIGGYVLLVPRKTLKPLNMSMEAAMRFTLTAGVASVTQPPAPISGGRRYKPSPDNNDDRDDETVGGF